MYEPPKLLRYGNFRNLTQAGVFGFNDQAFFQANAAGGNMGIGHGAGATGDIGTTETGSR